LLQETCPIIPHRDGPRPRDEGIAALDFLSGVSRIGPFAMLRVLLMLPLALLSPLLLAGCPSQSVEYSRTGAAYCPSCGTRLAGREVRCTVCDAKLRWIGEIRPCWHCDGSDSCRVCAGRGRLKGTDTQIGDKCFACKGTGECPECNLPAMPGMIEAGGS
jgi:hypothetical protein